MINVTKTYLPDFDQYVSYLRKIWDSSLLTNNGPFVQELEDGLKQYLGINQLYFCSNGTIVLQMALKLLDAPGEIITTPFSYVATTNVILWENCQPVFVDIDPKTYCINPALIEAAITPNTRAILATHVYGNACDVRAIEAIAKRHNLIVIYDGAHAFGAKYNGQSLLSYGDFSTCSFHATKVFHTIEGGIIIANEAKWHEKLQLLRAFGHRGDEYYFVGINGKNSEIHAAMGLCNLPKVPDLIAARKAVCELYDSLLNWNHLQVPEWVSGLERNYAYYPVVFESEDEMLTVKDFLNQHGISPRRYFYPSLNTLSFLTSANACPVSEDIALRVVCLPLHAELPHEDVRRIAALINQKLSS
ncbi:MAG: DegT/DnrJ/EryC1/StrS family aminotransferase [Spirosomataceae bacterium]